ncbi:MAG TPA: hypothetical protein VNI52_06270 [Sphingobacteriaceae bacterium]|nr:hypothetical protein [Sphingobacteriaceae bacterium]
MQKFLFDCFIFSLLFSIFYCILIIAIPGFLGVPTRYYTAESSNLGYSLQEVPSHTKIDILFLGSSHAYRGFDPRIFSEFGLSSLNLGSSAQTPLQTEALLRTYLKEIKPKIIIYEVSPIIFSLDGLESSVDLIWNSRLSFPILEMAFRTRSVHAINAIICSLIYKFLKPYDSNKNQLANGMEYISGGYVQTNGSSYIEIDYPDETLYFRPEQWDAFERTILLINQQGIELKIVQSPIVDSLYHARDYNSRFDTKISKVGFYTNFNKHLKLNKNIDFLDSEHLTSKGVQVFNRNLINHLNLKREVEKIIDLRK